jgi:uncharacterized HAD superfamily protein
MPSIILVDIDYTLADAAWRDPLLGKWDEYYAESGKDLPFGFVDFILTMAHEHGKRIMALTARPERTRCLTVRWLIKWEIPVDSILMRGDNDYRSAVEVKRDLVASLNLNEVMFVLEDRDDAVAAFRQMGLNVLQVYGVSNGRPPQGED